MLPAMVAVLCLATTARPLQGQGRGEVQVTAQVVHLEPTREAALAAAADPNATQISQLFRVTRMQPAATTRVADLRKEELVVVVEFLAN